MTEYFPWWQKKKKKPFLTSGWVMKDSAGEESLIENGSWLPAGAAGGLLHRLCSSASGCSASVSSTSVSWSEPQQGNFTKTKEAQLKATESSSRKKKKQEKQLLGETLCQWTPYKSKKKKKNICILSICISITVRPFFLTERILFLVSLKSLKANPNWRQRWYEFGICQLIKPFFTQC